MPREHSPSGENPGDDLVRLGKARKALVRALACSSIAAWTRSSVVLPDLSASLLPALPTRRGVTTTLNEIASSSKVGMIIGERQIPVRESVKRACEILGFDPLYVANEGRFICILPAEQAARAVAAINANTPEAAAVVIGTVKPGPAGRVTQRSVIGAERIVDRLSGEQLPRIC
jgi:hydrogenase expression/formation protein HypE